MAEPQERDAGEEERRARRARWLGRLVVIGFGLLLLAYLVPLFLGRIG